MKRMATQLFIYAFKPFNNGFLKILDLVFGRFWESGIFETLYSIIHVFFKVAILFDLNADCQGTGHAIENRTLNAIFQLHRLK